jgi:murein DD-endopeptidase MepM/ murein hydrolase activator NlpD
LAKKKKGKSKFRQKLIHDYRLVIMNHDTLEERISFKLNRLNVFVVSGVLVLLLIIFTYLLIAYTPLREYIPGYSSTKLKKKATELVYKVDSLEQKLKINETYIKSVQALLSGNIRSEDLKSKESIATPKVDNLNLNASHKDSIFRHDIEQKDRFSVFEQATKKNEIVFFAPVKGEITSNFNSKDKHFAIDIAVVKNTPVKAVADGTVVFSGFTADTGYVIILEHSQGFLSAYKHNETLFKEQGDLIKSGEVIANSGSTGNLTTGPHLHFELWSDGYPVNPTDFIDFKK